MNNDVILDGADNDNPSDHGAVYYKERFFSTIRGDEASA